MMEFIVPAGCSPGMTVQVQSPSGGLMAVQIPENAKPGDKLQIPVPVEAVAVVAAHPTMTATPEMAGATQAPTAPSSPIEQASFEELLRTGFVRKTYGILLVQLIVTFGLMMIIKAFFSDFIRTHIWVYYVAMAVSFASMIAIFCCQDTARTFPRNYLCLACLTLAQGVMLGVVSLMYKQESIFFAVAMTMIVVAGLTVYAAKTKTDFTAQGGYICAAALVFICLLIFVPIFYNGGIVRLLLGAVGCLIFSLFIVYDTQLIIGSPDAKKPHKYSFSVDDYAFAAANLYLDVINLFYMILMVSGDRE